MRDVFISYAKEDKIVADAVCATLESHAVRCWIAPRDVLPGVAYGEAIIDAIRSCRIMILVFSSKSNTSSHIPKEIERAVSAGVGVIPFRTEDVMPGKSLDYFIGSVHWLDALTRPLEQHLERLVQNVQTLLSRDAPVIEQEKSSAIAAPASSIASSPARPPWLYMLRWGIMAVLVIVFAVVLFARKPSKTARIAPAAVSSTPPSAAVASQPSGISSAGSSDAAVASKPAAPAAARRAPRKDFKPGVHDAARVPVQPETPASHAAAPQPQPRISLIKAFTCTGANSFRRLRNFTKRLAMAANAKDATILA